MIPVFLISVWFVYCISAVNINLVSSDSCTCAAVTEPEVCNLPESLVDSVQEFLIVAFKLWYKKLFFWQFCRELFLGLEVTISNSGRLCSLFNRFLISNVVKRFMGILLCSCFVCGNHSTRNIPFFVYWITSDKIRQNEFTQKILHYGQQRLY